jgi:hypothetical protein
MKTRLALAAALAAILVDLDTFDPTHQRLIDGRLLNVALVLMLTTHSRARSGWNIIRLACSRI